MQYYIWGSYRRKLLDKHLNNNLQYFNGTVLDIGGGRKRGNFSPPKTKKWLFADIDSRLNPDIVCNIEKMGFDDNSFETIKATELFEHVERPITGIKECYRVLKDGGYFIVSAPFLYPSHGDPYDYQRWTAHKWEKAAAESNFKIEKIIFIGYFFTVLADMLKVLNKIMPAPLKILGYLFYPMLDTLVLLDKLPIVLRNKRLTSYSTGYLIILKK